MPMTRTQDGVLRGMALGAAIAVAIVALGAWANPFGYSSAMALDARLAVALRAAVWPALTLVACVGRLARHRFFTPEDIDAAAGPPGTRRALILQAMLQNTLEQGVLASLAYLAWAVVLPGPALSVVPLAAGAFVISRGLFIAGYASGAAMRATGFAIGFYTTVLMLGTVTVAMAIGWFGQTAI